ncbi:MAG: LysR family transcriptional regulator [Thermodesulfobacteriota bacterium]
METKHLRTLLTIVELSSFTRAGVKLGLSQSAISQQIGALERKLGVKLLRRSGSGARPTAAGELLVDHARQILARIDNARRLVSEFDASPGGLLRIGAGGAACHHLLPDVLQALRESFPRLELHVRSGHTDLTLERLVEGEIDVGLLTLPVAHAKLRLVELGRDELVLIVAPAHPLASRTRVEPVDLASEPLLICERRSKTFQLVERVLLEAGVFPRVAMEIDHLEAVCKMVARGLGVSVVPRWAVASELAAGDVVAVPIGARAPSRGWAVGFLEESSPRQALRAFVRLCADQLPAVLEASANEPPDRRSAPL